MSTPDESRLFIKDVAIMASVGVYAHEKAAPQKIIVNIDVAVSPNPDWRADDISRVLSYEDLLNAIKTVAASGHIELLETFAEKVIEIILPHPLAIQVCVRIEKPKIFPEAKGAGVMISRRK
jgi:dihydroneopterin aldolase